VKTYFLYPTEDQEKMIQNFLEANDISFSEVGDNNEILPQHVLDGIKRGQEDIESGRFITLEEFKKRHLSSKR